MIEAGILLVIAVVLTFTGAYVWQAVAQAGLRRLDRLAVVAMAAFVIVGVSAYRLMNARGFQVLGEIVPRVATDQPVVALTFDDGPVAPYTEELLRVLDETGVKATFFVTGRSLENFPELGQRLVAAGHELGNHSYSHERMILKSYGFIRDELERTDRLIRVAGYTGEIHFRSPYAKKLFLLPLYLARNGKKNIIADVEPDAVVGTKAASMVEQAVAQASPGSIVILHAENSVRTESLAAVPGIIAGLKQKGYRFVTVSELLAP